ncbi:nucleotidyl transferase AbiEii/AbiGii toxin family protein [Streptomyces sp. NPDC006678]|uniref:nucleotidyl transferase AbiEii/AbiGii toxin family protein n=1 Tax=Streptomyces sp. NPDC006678 TaxID=3157185 RepID=UPI0033D3660C
MSTASERRAFPGSPEGPNEPADERERRQRDMPRTVLAPGGRPDDSVFDPALKHFAHAYRASEPRFSDPALAGAWRAARAEALDIVLCAIAGSQWADSLVLRGSVLLRAWFGDAARDPGDLDFVVVPADWRIEQDRTQRMLDGIAEAAQRTAEERGGAVGISARGAESEYIWTYERVPGRRMVLPWSAPGLPGGLVQLDFVFNEELPVPPEPARVGTAVVRAATPELSLAWKVMWLIDDSYPQGKDLYDAVLLAERHPLRYELLARVIRHAEAEPYPRDVELGDVAEIAQWVEWEQFVAEYPGVGDDDRRYVDRLVTALRPTFEARTAQDSTGQDSTGQDGTGES